MVARTQFKGEVPISDTRGKEDVEAPTSRTS